MTLSWDTLSASLLVFSSRKLSYSGLPYFTYVSIVFGETNAKIVPIRTATLIAYLYTNNSN